jgi:hypothetical protein
LPQNVFTPKEFLPVRLLCVAQNSENQSLLGFYEISEATRISKLHSFFERQSFGGDFIEKYKELGKKREWFFFNQFGSAIIL